MVLFTIFHFLDSIVHKIDHIRTDFVGCKLFLSLLLLLKSMSSHRRYNRRCSITRYNLEEESSSSYSHLFTNVIDLKIGPECNRVNNQEQERYSLTGEGLCSEIEKRKYKELEKQSSLQRLMEKMKKSRELKL